MPISIVLRTSGTINVFRDTVIDVLGSGLVDEALLCSGFFQENFKGSAYQASAESLLGSVCAKSKIKLTTVGIHNNTWKSSYKSFKSNMLACGANVICLYKPRMHWHAKIFIASKSGTPCLGIVGSSNITRNAFSTGEKYNNECDVFMWSNSSGLSGLADQTLARIDGQISVKAPYLRRYNQGMRLADQLARIRQEVLEQDLGELI